MIFISNQGFSYSDDESMYTTGDSETAQLNYELIIQFFERFPAFLANDMYISSESYGGHCKYPTSLKSILRQHIADGFAIH